MADAIEALRELMAARDAVEEGVVSFDLHNAAVARLEAAEKAARDVLAGVAAGPQTTPQVPEVPNCGNPDCPGYEHTHGHVHDPFAYECGEDVGPWVKHHHCTPRIVAAPTNQENDDG